MNHPLLYEINTRCWLRELSEKNGARITLGNVLESEFARWRELGFTHIWLMGVWTIGLRGRAEALTNEDLRKTYSEALPGWRKADVGGSPYAVADYKVARNLGGDAGLKKFRTKLRKYGLKLLLDFVPNHVGVDHPWTREQPDLFVQSPIEVPGTFPQETATGTRWLAHGKDPYFPGWTDTAQLDYRRFATRGAMKETLLAIAERCDGVRCDMAMLVLNDIFARTWAGFSVIGTTPQTEFWEEAIPSTKEEYPGFLFLAEAYWGLEGRLQQLGFDYTYDKELRDKIVYRDAVGVQNHLLGLTPEYIQASAHFLENHDESRIAASLSAVENRAAALLILGLPGMRFLHEGQLTGARIKMPVQLLRRPAETVDPEIQHFYEQMLTVLPQTAVGQGNFNLLKPRAAGADNPTAQNFVLVQWQRQPAEFDLVVINLAPLSQSMPLCRSWWKR